MATKAKTTKLIRALCNANELIDGARYEAARLANGKPSIGIQPLTKAINKAIWHLEESCRWLSDLAMPVQRYKLEQADAAARESIAILNSTRQDATILLRLNDSRRWINETLSEVAAANAR
jgi:hypothetical protein